MKQNKWIAVVIIMIIVSVIVSLITANVVVKSGPLLAPTLISANSCDADSVCEANSLNTKYITTTVVKGNGNLILATGNSGDIIIAPDTAKVLVRGTLIPTAFSSDWITAKTIKGNGDLILTTGNNGALILSPEKKSVIVQGTLTTDSFSVTNLKGTGNAYACIDSNGKIYRTLTACK